MARSRRKSATVEKTNQRILGATEIDANLDLGDGASLAALVSKRNAAQGALDKYNGLLVQVDAAATELGNVEKELRALSSRILAGIRFKYGADSTEYEKAGGIRTSERKRRGRSAPPA